MLIEVIYILVFCFPGENHEEEFEDTKGIIKIRISKKNRQRNGQKRKS